MTVWVGADDQSFIHAKQASWLTSSCFQRDVNNCPCLISALTVSCSLSINARFKNFLIFVPSTSTSGLLAEVNEGFGYRRDKLISSSSAYLCASVSAEEWPFYTALSSNIRTVLIVGSTFWWSSTAALIFGSLYSCSTDLRPRPPRCLGRYKTAVELSGCFSPFSWIIFLVSLPTALSSVIGQCWVHIK